MIEGVTTQELIQMGVLILKGIALGIAVIWGLLRLGGHKI